MRSPERGLIIGAGPTGLAHAKAFASLVDPERLAVFAPSEKGRAAVEQLGLKFLAGDLRVALEQVRPEFAVVVTPVEHLGRTVSTAIEAGVTRLLVEKPGALSVPEMEAVEAVIARAGAQASVAYNRRFFGSVRQALQLIRDSGEAVESVHCEFTEWAHVISELPGKSTLAFSRWLVGNSLHPIDLAFLPVGLPRPEESSFHRQGSLSWHPAGSRFTGSGITREGALFTCQANWGAPGRWGVEWLTPSTRYIFRPMEKLQVQRRGSVAIEELPLTGIGEAPAQDPKPGFILQASAFLGADPGVSRLCSWQEAKELVRLAERVAGYPAGN